MMKLNKFAQAVHENAVKHGWWDEERTFGEIIALCHSELSEALEEYRAKRPMLYYPCNAGGVCVDDAEGDNVSCGSRVTDPEHQEAACKARSKKPEGVAVELADCIIRVLDYFGKEELDVDALMQEAMNAVMCDVPGRIYAATLGDCISRWHLLLSLAYSCWCEASGTHASALRMARCVCEILAWGKVTDGLDFEMILDIKHEYNKTRPYRHGGKAL